MENKEPGLDFIVHNGEIMPIDQDTQSIRDEIHSQIMGVLVIDCRDRKLSTFMASATQVDRDHPDKLVLRHALEMGTMREILDNKTFTSPVPVLLMGEYHAQSSAGHVEVVANQRVRNSGRRYVKVVGGLGQAFGEGGLKALRRPIPAALVEAPVRIDELVTANNSNTKSASAAMTGVEILADTDPDSTFLVEGQSDYTYVVRLRSDAKNGETEFPTEHRSEIFSKV